MVSNVKRITAAFAAVVMFLACFAGFGLTAGARTEIQGVVYDIEGVLSDSDKAEMDVLLADTAEKVGFNVGIIFSDDLTGMSAREYTELFFDGVFGEKADGVMLLINGDFSGGDSSDWLCGAGEHGEKYAMESQDILSSCYYGLNKSGFRGLTESYCEYLLKDAGIASENSGVPSGYRAVLSDLDDKLTDAEEAELLSLMQETANHIECNVGVVITDDLLGKSDSKYANDFLDECFTFGSSSIVLLYNNDQSNKSYVDWISTCGRGSDLYDSRIDDIFDDVYAGLDPNDNYARSIRFFCEYLSAHDFDTSGYYDTDSPISTLMSFADVATFMFFPTIFGLFLAFVIAGSFAKSYKKKKPISASAYIDTNRTKFTRKNDIFVREFTTHHTISSSSSSGGHHSGGGGHHSSSHHSHGGGGGRHR